MKSHARSHARRLGLSLSDLMRKAQSSIRPRRVGGYWEGAGYGGYEQQQQRRQQQQQQGYGGDWTGGEGGWEDGEFVLDGQDGQGGGMQGQMAPNGMMQGQMMQQQRPMGQYGGVQQQQLSYQIPQQQFSGPSGYQPNAMLPNQNIPQYSQPGRFQQSAAYLTVPQNQGQSVQQNDGQGNGGGNGGVAPSAEEGS